MEITYLEGAAAEVLQRDVSEAITESLHFAESSGALSAEGFYRDGLVIKSLEQEE